MQKEGIFISQFENTFIIYRANLHYDKVREFYQYQSAENFNWQNIKTVESSFYTIYKAAQDSFSRA